jgi:hypothetical protein
MDINKETIDPGITVLITKDGSPHVIVGALTR